MGVPKFFRWMSERYPCLSQTVGAENVPEFDNFYLDMNGIIHNCSHPETADPSIIFTEDKIFEGVFAYLDNLFSIIRPKKLLYMAIDGVAPRAKMNQQRARRFRSAKEAEAEKAKLRARGISVEGRFDSNAITPGTEFMVRLQQQLEGFLHRKITLDPLWKGVDVIYSGHEVPGEGEHKIIDYIRWLKTSPQYNPSTRHCLYGLDADLVMLGLASHEPYFSLLREEVSFGRKKTPSKEGGTLFFLLSLTLLREYIELEFSSLTTSIPFPWDFECVLDDWIMMGFFVGNDFLPNLPNFHIREDIFPRMWEAYRTVLPRLSGYLTHRGVINMAHLEMLLRELDRIDLDSFQDKYFDTRYLESKRAQTPRTKHQAPPAPKGGFETFFGAAEGGASAGGEGEEGEGGNTTLLEFAQDKRAYYMEKLGLQTVDDAFVHGFALEYVRGLQWVLSYYFHGVPSWGWYFPHHYAPFVSDLQGLASFAPSFDLGRPFLPFQQLMSVMPPDCRNLLPKAYHDLMTSSSSPIVDFYPPTFTTDLNGKKQEWEALVLIPFVDESRLLSAMASVEPFLTPSERRRNVHSHALLFTSGGPPVSITIPSLGPFPSTASVVPLSSPHCPPGSDNYPVRHPAYNPSVIFPGFPSFASRPYACMFRQGVVSIFDSIAKGDSAIITPHPPSFPPKRGLGGLAKDLSTQPFFVNWPHLRTARFLYLTDGHHAYGPDGAARPFPPAEVPNLAAARAHLVEGLLRHRGIDVSSTQVLVFVNLSSGLRHEFRADGSAMLTQQWAAEEWAVPLELVVINPTVSPMFATAAPVAMHDLLPVGERVVFTGLSHYGHIGTVTNVDNGKVTVALRVPAPAAPGPFTSDVSTLIPMHALAAETGFSADTIKRIIGGLFVMADGKEADTDLGLNLRLNKRNTEKARFCRRVASGDFLLTPLGANIVRDYAMRFSAAMTTIQSQVSGNPTLSRFHLDKKTVTKIQEWLRTLPSSSEVPTTCGLEQLDAATRATINAVAAAPHDPPSTINITVSPASLVSQSMLAQSAAPVDTAATYQLGDRVVCIRHPSIAFGAEGAVVAVLPTGDVDVVFDFAVPGGTSLADTCVPGHGMRVASSQLMSLSHGWRSGGAALRLAPRAPAPVKAQQGVGGAAEGLTAFGAGAGVGAALAHSTPVSTATNTTTPSALPPPAPAAPIAPAAAAAAAAASATTTSAGASAANTSTTSETSPTKKGKAKKDKGDTTTAPPAAAAAATPSQPTPSKAGSKGGSSTSMQLPPHSSFHKLNLKGMDLQHPDVYAQIWKTLMGHGSATAPADGGAAAGSGAGAGAGGAGAGVAGGHGSGHSAGGKAKGDQGAPASAAHPAPSFTRPPNPYTRPPAPRPTLPHPTPSFPRPSVANPRAPPPTSNVRPRGPPPASNRPPPPPAQPLPPPPPAQPLLPPNAGVSGGVVAGVAPPPPLFAAAAPPPQPAPHPPANDSGLQSFF